MLIIGKQAPSENVSLCKDWILLFAELSVLIWHPCKRHLFAALNAKGRRPRRQHLMFVAIVHVSWFCTYVVAHSIVFNSSQDYFERVKSAFTRSHFVIIQRSLFFAETPPTPAATMQSSDKDGDSARVDDDYAVRGSPEHPLRRSETVDPSQFESQNRTAARKGGIVISIPPQTPGLGMRMAPEPLTIPLQAPRHGGIPLNAYEQYVQQDAQGTNTAATYAAATGASLPAPAVIPAPFSQRLRASMSGPSSPKEDPLSSGALGSAMLPLDGVPRAASGVGRTQLGQRGWAQTKVSVPASQISGIPLQGQTAFPHITSAAMLPPASTGRIAPGFDRNQSANVFFSPVHYTDQQDPLVITEGSEGRAGVPIIPHRYRGNHVESVPVLFSALGGSPVFAPNGTPGAAHQPSAFALDGDGDVPPSLLHVDPLSISQRDSGPHANAQEGIFSSLARRRYVLPPKAAAHAVAVAKDNMAAAGLLAPSGGLGDRTKLSKGILDHLMGVSSSPSAAPTPSHPTAMGSQPIASPFSPAAPPAMRHFAQANEGTAIHQVPPANVAGGLNSNALAAGERGDPLAMAMFETRLDGSCRPTSSRASAKRSSANITETDQSSPVQGHVSGDPSLGGTTSFTQAPANRSGQGALAAVHKYHRQSAPVSGARTVRGTGVSFSELGPQRDPNSPRHLPSSQAKPAALDGHPLGGLSFRYAPLYQSLDTSLSAYRPQAQPPVPMPMFDPMDGGENFPETSDSEPDDTLELRARQRQRSGFGSIGVGEDAPPLIVVARRAAEIAKKRQRRRARREKPPFTLPADYGFGVALTGVPKVFGPSNVRIGHSRFVQPRSCTVPLMHRPVLPSVVNSCGALVPPTPEQLSGAFYAHPRQNPLVSLLRRVSPLSVPLTWLLEMRRSEERFFMSDTMKMAAHLGMAQTSSAETGLTLSLSQKVAVLQHLPPPPFLSPKAIASELLLDAPASHGLFASCERSGTLIELARFCLQYPDALHFLEKVLEETDDPLSASNKAISFKKNSMAKDIIEGRERRRQRRMEKKGRETAPVPSPSPTSPLGASDAASSSSTDSSDDEGSDLEDLLLNNLGTNTAYQMDVVLPLFPQLEELVPLLKAFCDTTKADDTDESRLKNKAAAATVNRLIEALDPALHAEPSLSWPFHVLCSLVCFFVTALKVGFVPLFKSLRKGSLASSGKGVIAALAVSLSCKECLAVDDISGFSPEAPGDAASRDPRRAGYNPSNPFCYANRNSETEGKFYSDDAHRSHDLTLRKFLLSEATALLPSQESAEGSVPEASGSDAKCFMARRIHAAYIVRLKHFRQRLAEMGASPSRFCTLFPTTTEDGFFADIPRSPSEHAPHQHRASARDTHAVPSFHTLATVCDDFFSFEQTYASKPEESDDDADNLVREANSYGAGIDRGDRSRRRAEEDRRVQLIALQNERCEAIFFKHCVAALRAAQGVGLALESLRATSNIKPTTLVAPDGTLVEPDEDEEVCVARAAESGSDVSCDDSGAPKERAPGNTKSQRRPSPAARKKDTITNVNSKCSILVVDIDVSVLKIIITAVNDGRTSWVGVESSNAATSAARRGGVGEPPVGLDELFSSDGVDETLEKRQRAALRAAENPNSATRGAATVVGFVEIARVLCSRASIVSGHPSDIARLDLMLIQFGAFSGQKVHRDKLPIEVPENHSFYCGDLLQTAVLRIWKGVQHGYTYRADYNRLVAQRRRDRAYQRVRLRQERLAQRAERRLLREEAQERRRKERLSAAMLNTHGPNCDLFDENSGSSSSSTADSDGADAHYYADLAALAAESPFDEGGTDASTNAGVRQDLHDFERATRFYLSFLVHPSELGIDLLHPCTGESMRWIRGGVTENSKHTPHEKPSVGSPAEGDGEADLMYHNNDPSAQFRARFGGGYMNKARLKDAWTFMESLANAIASPRQNLNCSIDTIKQRNALRQRQSAAKHEEADEAIYAANRQSLYDGVLRETEAAAKGSANAPAASGPSVAAAVLQSMPPPHSVFPPTKWDAQPSDSPPSFSQAAISASRYGHPRDLLLDFSFSSRLRVGQILTWAHSSTAAGAFVSRNATNSAANDLLCVPQPMDVAEHGGSILKPPMRGRRSDVVSRTWLQLGIINQALASHVPQVIVTEVPAPAGAKSSLSIASERMKALNRQSDTSPQSPMESAAPAQRSAYDVADARLLHADGTPRVYCAADNFIQFQILRPVFFHAVDASPASKGSGTGSCDGGAAKAESDMPHIGSTCQAAVPANALLNAFTAKERVDDESDSDGSEEEVALSSHQFASLGGPSVSQMSPHALPSHTTVATPSPLADDPLTATGNRAANSASANDGFLMPVDRNGDVEHLLCFLGSVSGNDTLNTPPGADTVNGGSFGAPVVSAEGSSSALCPQGLLSSFDIAIHSSLPKAAGGIKPQHREKVRSARKALRSLVFSSPNARANVAMAMNLGDTTAAQPSAGGGGVTDQRGAAHQPVPIIDMGFGGRALHALEAGLAESPRMGRRRFQTRLAGLRGGRSDQGVTASHSRTPLIGTLLSSSQYRSWVEEGHDFGDGTMARRRRAGLDLAQDPSFTLHLMNIERLQKLSLRKGLRYLSRSKRRLEAYEASFKDAHSADDVVAIPAPPPAPPFTVETLVDKLSCHWLRTLLISGGDLSNQCFVGSAGLADKKGSDCAPDNRMSPKVSIVEPFSVSSYDTLQKVCEYGTADALVSAGGLSLLALGREASSHGHYGRQVVLGALGGKGEASVPSALVEYLSGVFSLHVGSPTSDTAREVFEMIGSPITGRAAKLCATPAPADSIGSGPPKSPLSIDTPMHSPERRTADALQALKNAPPVTVIPLGEQAPRADSVVPAGRGDEYTADMDASRSRANSRAGSPSVMLTSVNALMRSRSARSRASSHTANESSDRPREDGPAKCPFCSLNVPNARAMRIHQSYCEGSTAATHESVGATPTVSPQLASQGCPGANNPPQYSRNASLGNISAHHRQSPLTTPVTAAAVGGGGGGFERLVPKGSSAALDSRSASVGSQQPQTAAAVRTFSSSSADNACSAARMPPDCREGMSSQQSVTVVDLTGTERRVTTRLHPPANAHGLPRPMETPVEANQSLLASVACTPSPAGALLTPSDTAEECGTAFVVGRVQQAAVLHALLLNTRGPPAGAASLGRGLTPSAAGFDAGAGSSSATLTTRQTDSIAVIDVASANAVYGSCAVDDAVEVLSSYQFLVANPTLKNEADAVVLDLLQFIGSLRSSLMAKKEQLYQQVLVANFHLEQLRAITRSQQSITLSAASAVSTIHVPAAQSPLGELGASPRTPATPAEGMAATAEQLVANPYISIVILTHHIRQLMSAIEGCKRRREVLRQVGANYHRVKTGVMLTPQGLQFTDNLRKLTDLPFPRFTLLVCPTVLQLLEFWDALEFTTFYCGC